MGERFETPNTQKEPIPSITVDPNSDIGRSLSSLAHAEAAIQASAKKVADLEARGMEEFLQSNPQATEKIKDLIEKTRAYHRLYDEAARVLQETASAGKEVARLTEELYGTSKK